MRKKKNDMNEYIRWLRSYANQIELSRKDKHMAEDLFEIADYLKTLPRLEEKVGEWIPCSEQEEPTEDGMYLVSGRWLRSGEKVVDSCGFFGEWKCVNNFIIEAWMPLPPAYKGE